jgi:DNA-binding HxlR family transcriptional regulator
MKLEKITKKKSEAGNSRYDDACGTAHALELIGDRWALLILRELMLGGRRFSQIRADLPGISANILTQRLDELESRGVVLRVKLPSPAGVYVYELTPWGRETEPIIQAMGRWAARSPFHDPRLRISGVSSLLSLRTMYDRGKANGIDAIVGFRFGEDVYWSHVSSHGFTIARGEPEGASLIFTGQPEALMAAVHAGVSLSSLSAAGTLTTSGSLDLAQRFTKLFPLPPKVTLAPPEQSVPLSNLD